MTKTKGKNATTPIAGYDGLLCYIYERSMFDYKKAVKALKSNPNLHKQQKVKRECERFFLEDKYQTGLNGEVVIKKLNEQIEYELKDIKDLLIDLYVKQKLTIREVAEQLGYSPCRIVQLLDKYNIGERSGL